MLLLLMGLQPLAAQDVDSAATPIIYKASDLYPLDMLLPDIWETKFSGGVTGVYNPTKLTEAELARFRARTDSRIFFTPQPKTDLQNGFFVLLMGAWLLLSTLIYKNQQYFKSMLAALFNHRLALQFAREQVANRTAGSVIYLLIFNLLLAMLLMQLVYEQAAFLSKWPMAVLLPGILIGVTAIYLFKYMFYKALGILFGMRELVSHYLSQVFLINRLLGPALLLLLALIYYAPHEIAKISMYSTLLMLGLSLVWRYIYAIRQVTNVMVAHAFHFILYFCAVEIIPTAVIAKFLLHV
jgi:hypothetical protein